MPSKGKLDAGRRLARRRMAWLSFAMMCLTLMTLLVGGGFGGPLFATNMAAIAPALSGLVWAFAAIAGAYMGVSLTETLKKK